MLVVLFGASLLGSVSIGYSLLRVGFPDKQNLPLKEKLAYGYGLGILTFLPAMVMAITYSERSFFLIAGIFYLFLFTALYAKRVYKNESDTATLIVEKRIVPIPNKVLTQEEKEGKGRFVSKLKQEENIIPVTSKPKKRIIASPLRVVNDKPRKEQIFKEKETNVIEKLRQKTIQINKEDEDTKQKDTLSKLKGFAKQIDKVKAKKSKDDDELEEMPEIDESDF